MLQQQATSSLECASKIFTSKYDTGISFQPQTVDNFGIDLRFKKTNAKILVQRHEKTIFFHLWSAYRAERNKILKMSVRSYHIPVFHSTISYRQH